jgi:hypothetical protein
MAQVKNSEIVKAQNKRIKIWAEPLIFFFINLLKRDIRFQGDNFIIKTQELSVERSGIVTELWFHGDSINRKLVITCGIVISASHQNNAILLEFSCDTNHKILGPGTFSKEVKSWTQEQIPYEFIPVQTFLLKQEVENIVEFFTKNL